MRSATVSFGYGTSIMPKYVNCVTVIPNLQIIDPRKYDEEAKKNFAENLSTDRRKGKNFELKGRYPSVSALLGSTEENLTNLYEWQLNKVKEMGMDEFQNYMKTRTTSGTKFHKAIETLLNQLQQFGSINDEAFEKALEDANGVENQGYIKSIIPFLKKLRKTEWMKIEMATSNHYYCYQGRFDAIIEIDGKPTLVDWKSVSSDANKHNTIQKTNDLEYLYGAPLQVCAYIAAVNTDPDYRTLPKIQQGAIVLAYQDGRPAEIVLIQQDDLKNYFEILAGKINSFWWKLLYPKTTDKDSNGNVNFIFNPNVLELKDGRIIDKSQNLKSNGQEERINPKVYALFERKNDNPVTETRFDITLTKKFINGPYQFIRTYIPVTIETLNETKFNPSFPTIEYGKYHFKKVRIICNIVSFTKGANFLYRVRDYGNDEQPPFNVIEFSTKEYETIPLNEGTTVQIFGKIEVENDNFFINAVKIHLVENIGQIKVFPKEARISKLYFTKNVPDRITDEDDEQMASLVKTCLSPLPNTSNSTA